MNENLQMGNGHMKPILFNTEMVRALLAGIKTTTRRVIRQQPRGKLREGSGPYVFFWDSDIRYPPCVPGDILYVRETWGDYREFSQDNDGFFYLYRADYPDGATTVPLPENEKTDYADAWDLPKWHPSIHMPKEAARFFLRVTDVRVERLQEITATDCEKEGAVHIDNPLIREDPETYAAYSRKEFSRVWDSTLKHMDHIRYCWNANPWVWVIEFERYK